MDGRALAPGCIARVVQLRLEGGCHGMDQVTLLGSELGQVQPVCKEKGESHLVSEQEGQNSDTQ
jgi:hypothetical protein